VLKNAKIATRLPAQDLNRARAFYAEKLGFVDDIEATVRELERLVGDRIDAAGRRGVVGFKTAEAGD
jgi:hypothetical protein